MKIIRKISLFLLSIVMITTLFGCSVQNDMTEIDIGDLSSELLERAEFEDELSAINDTTIKKLYNIDNYTKAVVYISSGATAEEIAVFEFDSKETAADGLKKALVRIEEQKAGFESYIPREIQKLDNAVVKQSGEYVIICISNNNEAEKIITQYISGSKEE